MFPGTAESTVKCRLLFSVRAGRIFSQTAPYGPRALARTFCDKVSCRSHAGQHGLGLHQVLLLLGTGLGAEVEVLQEPVTLLVQVAHDLLHHAGLLLLVRELALVIAEVCLKVGLRLGLLLRQGHIRLALLGRVGQGLLVVLLGGGLGSPLSWVGYFLV